MCSTYPSTYCVIIHSWWQIYIPSQHHHMDIHIYCHYITLTVKHRYVTINLHLAQILSPSLNRPWTYFWTNSSPLAPLFLRHWKQQVLCKPKESLQNIILTFCSFLTYIWSKEHVVRLIYFYDLKNFGETKKHSILPSWEVHIVTCFTFPIPINPRLWL